MSQHIPSGYKKWCEHCRLMIAANEFNDHLKSRRHQKNKQRDLDFSNQKHRRERQQQQKQQKDDKPDFLKEIEKKAQLAMANYEKDNEKVKKIMNNDMDGDMDKEIRKDYNPDNFMSRADYNKTQIAQQGEENENQQVILPGSDNLKKQLGKIWQLERDKKSKKLFFYNNISKEKRFSKPMGLKLDKDEQKIWDKEVERIQQQGSDSDVVSDSDEENENSEDENQNEVNEEEKDSEELEYEKNKKMNQNTKRDKSVGMIQTQWEVVEEEDNYFSKYAARNSESEEEEDEEIAQQQQTGEQKQQGMDRRLIRQGEDQEQEQQLDGGAIVDLQDAEDFAAQQQETRLERMEREIESGKQFTEAEMMEVILGDKLKDEKGNLNKVKLKNENLKELIEKNIELPSNLGKRTFQKKNFVTEEKKTEKKGFKKTFKKRVLENKKTIQIGLDDDAD